MTSQEEATIQLLLKTSSEPMLHPLDCEKLDNLDFCLGWHLAYQRFSDALQSVINDPDDLSFFTRAIDRVLLSPQPVAAKERMLPCASTSAPQDCALNGRNRYDYRKSDRQDVEAMIEHLHSLGARVQYAHSESRPSKWEADAGQVASIARKECD